MRTKNLMFFSSLLMICMTFFSCKNTCYTCTDCIPCQTCTNCDIETNNTTFCVSDYGSELLFEAAIVVVELNGCECEEDILSNANGEYCEKDYSDEDAFTTDMTSLEASYNCTCIEQD